MNLLDLYQSRDMCNVCGQTPCNCTHLTEAANPAQQAAIAIAMKKAGKKPQTEGVGDIGQQIKSLYQQIYDQGDDAVEFMYYDSPIFAQYWDEYEGDLDSIIAEVDPSELQIIYDELQSAVEDQGLAEGAEFGSRYAEQLAQQVFNHNPNIEDENQVLDLGYNISKSDLGSRAQGMFRDEDFPSDFVSAYFYLQKQGVAEGSNDTIYPNAEVIKSKNGKPVGEIYQDGNEWGCFHYKADRGYDMIDSREDAIEALKDLHQETSRSRPDYTIKGVAEGSLNELSPGLLQRAAQGAKVKRDQAMDPEVHSALGGGYMNPLARHYDTVAKKFGDKAVKAGQRDAVKKIASPAVMRKIGLQGVAEGSISTYILNVMDEATGEHWAIEIQATSPEMAKERAIQQGYKVLRIKEKGVAEMDKSQPSHGRDGRISHSTYGSRDKQSTVGGKEHTAKMTTAEKMMKDAHDAMMKSLSNAEKADKGWRNPNIDEVSDKTLIDYLKAVEADALKHSADPSKRSPEKASRSVQGFSRAFNKLDARKEPVNEISPEGPDSDEDYREWERLKDVHKKPYNPDWDDDDEEFMQKWYRERGLEETTDQEADYGKSYQDMVKRMGAKAREQEQSRPVDIGDLARRLRAIEKKSGN